MASRATGPVQLCPLWALASDKAAQAAGSQGPIEIHVFIVGPRGCGKTTLLRRVLNPAAALAEPPPPSGAVEYVYARRGGGGSDAGRLAHFWELGGNETAAAALMQSQHVFLTAKQVPAATVVICADLSNPASVLAATERWLAAVKARLQAAYAAYEQRGLQVPEQLRQRARARLGPSHEDAAAIDVTGISLMVVATKWDTLCERDAGEQRVLAAALRCLAHKNGAHLACIGGLQPGGGAAAAAQGSKNASSSSSVKHQTAALDSFGRLMLSVAFGVLDKRLPPPQLAPLAPVFASAGADRLRGIGWPDGRACGPSSAAGAALQLEAWRAEVAALFPAAAAGAAAPVRRPPLEAARYAEGDVDAARAATEDALGWGAAAVASEASGTEGATAVSGERARHAAEGRSRGTPPQPRRGVPKQRGTGEQQAATLTAQQPAADPAPVLAAVASSAATSSAAARGALSRLKRPPSGPAAPRTS